VATGRQRRSVNEAEPVLKLAVPSTAAPSRNRTLPVAEPGETEAMNVTGCPAVPGFTEEEIVATEPALFTV